MKSRLVGIFAISTLCASMLSGQQLTSFESGLSPWFFDAPSGATSAGINSTSATDGASSAEMVLPMTSNVYQGFLQVGVSNYTATIAGAASIQADIFFQWDSMPAFSGDFSSGPYFGVPLLFNYDGGFSTVDPTSGSLSNGSYVTLTYDLPTGMAATLTNPSLGYSNIGFLLNAGTYGSSATIGGTITVRVDNVRVVPAAVPEPATVGVLMAVAGLGFTLWRRRGRSA